MPHIPPLPMRRESLAVQKTPPIPPYPVSRIKHSSKQRPHSSEVISTKKHFKKMAVVSLDRLQVENTNVYSFEDKNMWCECFKTLYDFYESGQLCDVQIKTGKKIIKCHRTVLACVSGYFRAMFLSEMAESKQDAITIHDIDESALEALIKFAYTAKIVLAIDTVQPILYAASILQIETVAEACAEFMKSHLHPSNCLGVHNFAEQHGRKELMKMADDYILEHFTEVADGEEFLSMSHKLLEILLSSADLNVASEAQVYETVMRWVKHDVMARECHLAKLISKLRLPLLDPKYLMETVETETLLKKSLDCRDLLDEAKYYQMSLVSLVPEVKVKENTQPRKSYSGVLFCVGGRGASGDPFKSIECYDPRKNRWFQIAEMHTRRRHVGVCTAGGKVFAVGGHDGIDHLSSAEVFDSSMNEWNKISSMGTMRRGIALACLGGPIYAVGGLDDSSCFHTVERYDPESDAWTFVASMNTPRGGVGVAALKGQLYAIGGNDGTTSLDRCERYDPFVNKWFSIACMNKRRAGSGVSVLNGCVYVVGGFDDNSPLDSVEKYEPNANIWTKVAKMSCCRGGVGVSTLGGKIFAVGGHDGTNYLNSVEAYDPINNRWDLLAGIDVCRAGAGVAMLDCRSKSLQDIAKTNVPGPAGRL